MTKKILLILPLLLSIGLANALTLMPQNDVSCSLNYCSLSINISKYLSATNLNSLKSFNLSALITKTKELDLKFSWNKETITFYADIKPFSSNYWSLNIPFLNLKIDPWFNSSYWSWSNEYQYNFSSGTIAGDGDKWYRGFEFIGASMLNVSTYILETGFTVIDCVIIRNLTNTVIYNGTNSENKTTFNGGAILNASESYRLVCDADKFEYTTGNSFPIIGETFNITKCIESAEATTYGVCPEGWMENEGSEIITRRNDTGMANIYYETNLTLNEQENNITICNYTPLDILAYSNLTGLNVSLYRNNTFLNWSLTSVSNSSSLSIDYYNITAYFYNASTNATITYFANVIYCLHIANYSYRICSDNNTLYFHNYNYVMGVANYSDTYFYCPNGCDNVSYSCNLLEYEANAFNLFWVILIIIGCVLVFRWVKK